MPLRNPSNITKKRNMETQLPLEHTFSFCKTFKKATRGLGFPIIFKRADLQDFVFYQHNNSCRY